MRGIQPIVASPLNWAGMYAYLWAAQGIFMSDLWERKKSIEFNYEQFMRKGFKNKIAWHGLTGPWPIANQTPSLNATRSWAVYEQFMSNPWSGEREGKNPLSGPGVDLGHGPIGAWPAANQMPSERTHIMSNLWAVYDRVVYRWNRPWCDTVRSRQHAN